MYIMLTPCASDDLKNRFENKLLHGHDLLLSLDTLKKDVLGVSKLKKKIRQELAFLNRVMNSGVMKNEHLLSTNLHHFDALVSCIFNSDGVVSVLETKSYIDENNLPRKLCIDIICEDGQKWIKVIARNPKALCQILTGGGEYGQKSIADHAADYINCAKTNHYLFQQPQVYFYFASGVTKTVAHSLKQVNVNVLGNFIDESVSEEELATTFVNDEELCSQNVLDPFCDFNASTCDSFNDNNVWQRRKEINLINLDVSTMIAYISALTNGGCNWRFKEPILNQQAEWERKRPVKPVLDDIFQGRKLICCETAYNSFREIVDIIGGPSEKLRAKQLMSVTEIVPDVPLVGIRLRGKIKPRSLVIFGTGYHHKALTATANEGFIRAIKHQGVDLAVIVHESRALTEIKQENCL